MKKVLLDFDEYIVVCEPHKQERAEVWNMVPGLQVVNKLIR